MERSWCDDRFVDCTTTDEDIETDEEEEEEERVVVSFVGGGFDWNVFDRVETSSGA